VVGGFGVSDIYLADIGNTHIHIYCDGAIEHFTHQRAIELYGDKRIFFISVKDRLKIPKNWVDISSDIYIDGEYSTMGVDRKALCLSYRSGIFVDAGSAITIDVVKDGIYQGGTICLGIKAMLNGYKNISKALDIELDRKIDISKLHTTTKEQISYGIIASIKSIIDINRGTLPLYLTGGDGRLLAQFFDDAIYDESLVFQGMNKILKDKGII
jgi:type III pantothenate kinase